MRTATPGVPGLLIEMTDGTFEANHDFRQGVGLYYDLVKASVHRLLVALTHELRDHPVTPLAVTPGWIRSEAMLEHFGVREDNWCDALDRVPGFAISETPTYVGRGVAALATDSSHGRHAGTCLSSHDLAAAYDVTDVDGSQPDCWRLIADTGFGEEHADVDVTGYR